MGEGGNFFWQFFIAPSRQIWNGVLDWLDSIVLLAWSMQMLYTCRQEVNCSACMVYANVIDLQARSPAGNMQAYLTLNSTTSCALQRLTDQLQLCCLHDLLDLLDLASPGVAVAWGQKLASRSRKLLSCASHGTSRVVKKMFNCDNELIKVSWQLII